MRKLTVEAMSELNGGTTIWMQCPICAQMMYEEYNSFNFLFLPEYAARMRLMNKYNAHYYSHGLNAK